MPNSKDVFKWVVSQITLDESADEVNSIAYLLLDKKLNISKSQVIAANPLANVSPQSLLPWIERINQGEPIQYIIGSQDFYGRSFIVNPSVLIPRPETEQLTSILIQHLKSINSKSQILDIGTGSGCIPITLQLEVTDVTGFGIDISASAIATAKENNRIHNTSIQFLISDVLNDSLPPSNFDVIASNPPYITEDEKVAIKPNVLEFEPHSALFVPNNDPLKFYKVIIEKSKTSLKRKGLLAFEVNERFGMQVAELFKEHGYESIEVIKDYFGKDRIVKGLKFQ
ncbi:MAG TPA: peptide chain release factor N(5)-glutamine methyltransferase [Cytophagales bacterium]|nr:peptide chain release factor N(5)-glutamine methyltransferase [Cytophagales bacterium]